MQPVTAVEPKPLSPQFEGRNRKYEIRVGHPDYEDGKPCTVRYPTDEEWSQRNRHQSRAIRTLTGGAHTTEDKHTAEAADELFQRIREDKDGPEFEAEEALYVIGRLEACMNINVELEGNHYRVEFELAKELSNSPDPILIEHVLRTPTQRQLVNHRRAAYSHVARRQIIESKTYMEPSAELWEKLSVKVAGYAPGADVPIVHKHIAVVMLIDELDSAVRGGPAPEA